MTMMILDRFGLPPAALTSVGVDTVQRGPRSMRPKSHWLTSCAQWYRFLIVSDREAVGVYEHRIQSLSIRSWFLADSAQNGIFLAQRSGRNRPSELLWK